jgi:pyrimidine deaminase RibD-like protein
MEQLQGQAGIFGRDEHWMRMAVQLARDSIGLASPNPHVGCVIVKDGSVVGRGAHLYDHKDHAEVVALREAGGEARGATAYVTLEPCAHSGRTGPCAVALLQAGVARVVVATGDPNPQVNGKGAAVLREGGVAVDLGTLAEDARWAHRAGEGGAAGGHGDLPHRGPFLDGCAPHAACGRRRAHRRGYGAGG